MSTSILAISKAMARRVSKLKKFTTRSLHSLEAQRTQSLRNIDRLDHYLRIACSYMETQCDSIGRPASRCAQAIPVSLLQLLLSVLRVSVVSLLIPWSLRALRREGPKVWQDQQNDRKDNQSEWDTHLQVINKAVPARAHNQNVGGMGYGGHKAG